LWKGHKDWTVYDMYSAILHEITFCGLPEDQIRHLAEIDQRIAEAKDWMKRKAEQEKDEEDSL